MKNKIYLAIQYSSSLALAGQIKGAINLAKLASANARGRPQQELRVGNVVLRAEDVELLAVDNSIGHQALHGLHGNISVGQDGCLQLALHFRELDIVRLHGQVGQRHVDRMGTYGSRRSDRQKRKRRSLNGCSTRLNQTVGCFSAENASLKKNAEYYAKDQIFRTK